MSHLGKQSKLCNSNNGAGPVFEKLWIFDGDVAGTELAESYAGLVTLESRLVLCRS